MFQCALEVETLQIIRHGQPIENSLSYVVKLVRVQAARAHAKLQDTWLPTLLSSICPGAMRRSAFEPFEYICGHPACFAERLLLQIVGTSLIRVANGYTF